MNRPIERPFTIGLFLNLVKGLGLGISDLELMDYGTVIDMLIEKENNNFNYKQLATQEDFDRF